MARQGINRGTRRIFKNMQKKKQQEEMENQVNPFDYGYKPGAGVNIPAELFMAIMEFTQVVARNETEEKIKVASFKAGEQPKEIDELVEVFITPIGKRGGDIFHSLLETHFANIDSGLAVSHTAPEFKFEDVPTDVDKEQ